MKCFIIFLLVAYSIAIISTKDIADNRLTSEESTSVPAQKPSIRSLFHGIAYLVKGVLYEDKNVLRKLDLTPPLDLTNDQIKELKQLLRALNRLNTDLEREDK